MAVTQKFSKFANVKQNSNVDLIPQVLDNFNVMRGEVLTIDATITTIQAVPIPLGKTVLLEARVLGNRTGGSSGATGDSGTYVIRARAKNVLGTVTLFGMSADESEDQLAWNSDMVVSGTDVLIRVQGAANNNVLWNIVTLYQQG